MDRKRKIYVIGENHTDSKSITEDKIKNIIGDNLTKPLFFGERGMKDKYINISEDMFIEEDQKINDIPFGIYAFSGLYDYLKNPQNIVVYDKLSQALVSKGYLKEHIIPFSCPKWIDIAKENLLNFIKTSMKDVGISDNIQKSIITELKEGNYFSAIKISENFRNDNIHSKIMYFHKKICISRPFVIIVGYNHVQHLMKILKSFNIFKIYKKSRRATERVVERSDTMSE